MKKRSIIFEVEKEMGEVRNTPITHNSKPYSPQCTRESYPAGKTNVIHFAHQKKEER